MAVTTVATPALASSSAAAVVSSLDSRWPAVRTMPPATSIATATLAERLHELLERGRPGGGADDDALDSSR
jgi:hypothetical protein